MAIHGKDKRNGDYLGPQRGANYRCTCGCATFLSETGAQQTLKRMITQNWLLSKTITIHYDHYASI